jgi:hypothetical protein
LNTRFFPKKALFFCVGCLFLTSNAFSDIKTNPSAHRYELFVSSGVSFPWLNNIAAVAMNSTITNTYYVQAQRQWGLVVGGGIARAFSAGRHVRITLGPSAYYVDFNKIQGVESPFSNGGSFDTLNYNFFADSAALFLESRLIITAFRWQPVFVLGAGNAWNRLYSYNEVPTDPNGSASAATDVFHNNTISSFAYEAGVGIRHLLFASKNQVTYCSLDYRYFNLGAGKFAPSSLQTSNQVLGVKTLHTSAILLSLSAAFH